MFILGTAKERGSGQAAIVNRRRRVLPGIYCVGQEHSMPSESLHDLLEGVNSERSLLDFIAALIRDREEAVAAQKRNPASPYGPDAGGWENISIEGFLEAAAAWAESTNFGLSQGLHPNNPWRRFAAFLYCGKIYE